MDVLNFDFLEVWLGLSLLATAASIRIIDSLKQRAAAVAAGIIPSGAKAERASCRPSSIIPATISKIRAASLA